MYTSRLAGHQVSTEHCVDRRTQQLTVGKGSLHRRREGQAEFKTSSGCSFLDLLCSYYQSISSSFAVATKIQIDLVQPWTGVVVNECREISAHLGIGILEFDLHSSYEWRIDVIEDVYASPL